MNQQAEIGCPSGLEPGNPESTVQDPAAFVKHEGAVNTLDLLVRGARCGGCLSKIENGVGALSGVQTARMNLSTGRLRVEWTGDLPARSVVQTVVGLGYGAAAFDPGEADKSNLQAERRLLIAMAVAGFAAANVMLLSVSVWAGVVDMNTETRQLMHWVAALIATPAALFSGQTFFQSAWASIRARKLNMDVPISLAVILALGMSLLETIRGGEHAYFDAAVTLLFFLLIGRFLDARLRRRAYASANALAAMQTSTATRINDKGEAEAVRVSDLMVGDVLILSAGERLGVDAELLSGDTDMDLRMVTGEVEPASVHPGMTVHAGAVNLSIPVWVRVLATAENSLLSDVARLLEAGEQKRSTYRRIADRASEIYVPTVHITAALALIGWLFVGATLQHAVFIAVTVLIITCPCALALAAPVVQVVAAGRLFRENAFLASGDALERIAAVDHIVFDKTGTLTLGDPVLLPGANSAQDIQRAALLARASRHPFSRAIVRAAGAGPLGDKIEEHPGQGVSGVIEGQPARLGSAAYVGIPGDVARSSLWLQMGDGKPVAFRFADVVRPDARETIQKLRAMGVTAEILSGDGEDRVAKAAAAVGIDAWISGATPQSKAARLDALEAAGHKVMMVGDGLNDAGALSKAHASLAPGGAVDVSRLASDCVFSGDSLAAVAKIIRIARSARSRMLENFAFAALYNVVAIPIALAGWATPMVAAIAMSSSSLIVTLNALRLRGEMSQ